MSTFHMKCLTKVQDQLNRIFILQLLIVIHIIIIISIYFVCIVVDKEHYQPVPKEDCDQLDVNKLTVIHEPARIVQPHWLLRRIFILTWIRDYDRQKAVADLIAGITLGLTIIPQSIAYASLAGLSSEYGLYSAFMGSFVYVIFGSIAQVSIGPTSLMAILTLQFTSHLSVQFVIALAFLAGVVELLMGLFKLGFLVNFISSPVTSAFTTATSIIVIGAQMRNLLGIPKGMFKSYKDIPSMFEKISVGDATLGFICIITLLSLRQLSYVNLSPKKAALKKILWYISISRNAIVVCVASFLAYYWVNSGSDSTVPFRLNAKVNSSVPTFKLPPFSIDYENVTYGFTDILRELGSGIVVVPLVAVLANVAIAKAFGEFSTFGIFLFY